jgi:hypothetical protein
MSRKNLKGIYVARYCGDNEEGDAKLTFIEEHEDGVYEHADFELRLTIRCGDHGVLNLREIHWQHTLIYLQAELPDYIEGYCPDPETAS